MNDNDLMWTTRPGDLFGRQTLHPREEVSILELGKLGRDMVGESGQLVLKICQRNTVYALKLAQNWKRFAHVC